MVKNTSKTPKPLKNKLWKPWGDHPLIVGCLLTCSLIALLLGCLQYLSTRNIGISPNLPQTKKPITRTVLGLYVDDSASLDEVSLANEKSKIKDVFYALSPDNIDILQFGGNNPPIWRAKADTYKIFSKEKENKDVEDFCKPSNIFNEGFSEDCERAVRQGSRISNIEAEKKIDGILDIISDKSAGEDPCINFQELKKRIIDDGHDVNIIITDGNKDCGQPNVGSVENQKIIILLIPSPFDTSESFEVRKQILEGIFSYRCSFKTYRLVSASSEQITNGLKN